MSDWEGEKGKETIGDIASFVVREGLKLDLDEVATSISHDIARQVRFSNNVVTVTKSWDNILVDVLASKRERITTGTTSDLSKRSLTRMLKQISRTADVIKPHDSYSPLPEGPFSYRPVEGVFDSGITKLGDECVDYVEEAINSALENGAQVAAGTLLVGWRTESLQTSRGVEAFERGSFVNITVRGSVKVVDGKVYGIGTSSGRTLKQFDPGKAGETAGRYALMSKRVTKAKEGRHDTVLGRPALGNFLGSVSIMTSAFNVDSGLSCFVDKIGRKVASMWVTLYDDPRVKGGLGSRSFDEEGRPTRRTVIMDGGVLKTYLHNRLTAGKFGTESTANAGWIAPMPWNVVLTPGEFSEEGIMEEVKDGLFVNNMTYTRFQNYRTGDFSSIVRDGVFVIRNGEITGAVKGLRLSDNVSRMLIDTIGLSKESEPVLHWWMEMGVPVTTPLALVKGVKFTLPTA